MSMGVARLDAETLGKDYLQDLARSDILPPGGDHRFKLAPLQVGREAAPSGAASLPAAEAP